MFTLLRHEISTWTVADQLAVELDTATLYCRWHTAAVPEP